MTWRCGLCWAIGLSACTSERVEPRTQLILVADTDIAALRQVRFEARQGARSSLPTAGRITPNTPSYVSLEPARGGDRTIVLVSATGLDEAGNELIVRTARVAFVANETKVVPLHLLSVCEPIYASCELGETCTEAAECVSDELSASELQDWSGKPPSLVEAPGGGDAGEATSGGASLDSGIDGGGSTSGNPGGSSSGGTTGGSSGGSTSSSSGGDTGGGSGTSGAGGSSSGGTTGASSGGSTSDSSGGSSGGSTSDSSGGSSGGSTSDSSGGSTSGSSGGSGSSSGGTEPDAGSDAGAGVDAGTGTCRGRPVDTGTDPAHCGRCDNACPVGPHGSAVCRAGRCSLECEPTFADCNASSQAPDGCESDLTSIQTCGNCTTRCVGNRECIQGVCTK